LNPATIERIPVPTALEFHRYVAANRPVIVQLPTKHNLYGDEEEEEEATEEEKSGAATKQQQWQWPAFDKWDNDYLTSKLGDKQITVACTPDGWADAVKDGEFFVMPCERKMTFTEFLKGMSVGQKQQQSDHEPTEGMSEKVVQYIQLQNGNLTTEYEELMQDVPDEIEFASEALGRVPDAVNFWYGDARSTTSLHKDHYENIYAVITGKKIFTLIPPTEQFCLHEKKYTAAVYVDNDNVSSPSSSSSLSLQPLDPPTRTKWIELNPADYLGHHGEVSPYSADGRTTDNAPKHPTPTDRATFLERYPRFKHCRPFRVVLNPGELLYLPAMWYHQVEQVGDLKEDKCIAVNWWYDMDYAGDRFAQTGFMTKLLRLLDEDDADDDDVDGDSLLSDIDSDNSSQDEET
ncbi:JmjC domain-containing protein 7, partial [Actinomortierella wolfii]